MAQYYIMYGTQDVITEANKAEEIPEPSYSGAANVDKVFFLGVPFGGSPHAFKTLHEGEYLGPFVYASQWITFTMPSIYEMLPLDTTSLFIDASENPVMVDHFSVDNWIRYGMGIFSGGEWSKFEKECSLVFPEAGDALSHRRRFEFRDFMRAALKRGKLFQTALAKMDWDKVDTKQIMFSGNCYKTMSQVEWIEKKNEQPLIRAVKSKRFKEKYYRTAKGDDTVLLDSQLKAGRQADQVLIDCFRHRRMPANPVIQKAIINQL